MGKNTKPRIGVGFCVNGWTKESPIMVRGYFTDRLLLVVLILFLFVHIQV